ncbi:DUF2949 domain-containing protein [Anabaena sp. FACHB-1237]|uniref:DUF2949 domain-containing protein n=1 Tax=Anabaena sp. FACHB-1237 TaxID=2692769 RepID=UPI001680E099|nr:DUF2949 domain-containing protein [Anabaena sp. FACHB-1237]MBD2136693.1 DUF2949 domain-containing protein [Anabaena sp. FACHB-1237]
MLIQSTQVHEMSKAKSRYSQFINFLQEDLAISSASLSVAVRQHDQDPSLLTMTLWQYGLITIDQVEQIYTWLESV